MTALPVDARLGAMPQQIAVDKTRKCQGDEQGTGHGIKLPLLVRNLPGTLLQEQTDATHHKIQQQQFGKAHYQRLSLLQPRPQHQHPVVGKWQIGGQASQKDHEPDGSRL